MFFRSTKMEEPKETPSGEAAENKGTLFILDLMYRQTDIGPNFRVTIRKTNTIYLLGAKLLLNLGCFSVSVR